MKVRELVAQGDIAVHHVPTELNHSDVLTKPLDHATFTKHVRVLCGDASIP